MNRQDYLSTEPLPGLHWSERSLFDGITEISPEERATPDVVTLALLLTIAELRVDSDPLDLVSLQQTLPWDDSDYRPDTDHASHALHHITKATGRLSELIEAGHHSPPLKIQDREDFPRFLADVVISALRLANKWPGGRINLAFHVAARFREISRRSLERRTS